MLRAAARRRPDRIAAIDSQSIRRKSDLFATVVFLMTEYVEQPDAQRRPLLAALIAGELAALERRIGDEDELRSILHRLRHRWWRIAQAADDGIPADAA